MSPALKSAQPGIVPGGRAGHPEESRNSILPDEWAGCACRSLPGTASAAKDPRRTRNDRLRFVLRMQDAPAAARLRCWVEALLIPSGRSRPSNEAVDQRLHASPRHQGTECGLKKADFYAGEIDHRKPLLQLSAVQRVDRQSKLTMDVDRAMEIVVLDVREEHHTRVYEDR